MTPKLLLTSLIIFVTLCTATQITKAVQRPINFVEPRIGTAPSVTKTAGIFGKKTEEFGQCLPAVLEPNGMNFWTPQTRDTEKKCVAPYYYNDSRIQGFRNSHWIVGGCTQDYGSMTLMPLSEKLKTSPEQRASKFSHDTETASPAYYSVTLEDYGIFAEMTGKSRSAIFRFSYTDGKRGHLVINPNSDEGQGYIEIDTVNHLIKGFNPVHRIYQGWGEPAGFSGYFVVCWPATLNITSVGCFRGDSVISNLTSLSNLPAIGAYIEFELPVDKTVTFTAASSFTSIEGALTNLTAELNDKDFDQVRNELENIWNKRLGLINVEGGSVTELTKFYSALYRASMLPRTFNDIDGSYPAFGGDYKTLIISKGHNYYDDFSMWDTYRALHPLLNIIDQRGSSDMMQSLVLKYRQGGWLPIFPCWNSYTSAMIGDHCTVALADAYIKGIHDFDISDAYTAMRKNAFETPESFQEYKNGMGRRALSSYNKYGYIPLQDSVPEAFHKREQVSRTLEYAFDDFALAQVAKILGYDDDADILSQRAMNYRNVINPTTGYAQGRNSDGSFLNQPDNAFKFVKFITEGAPCHYTWYVPHDQYGLMELMGGQAAYIARLDSMFSEGRYWHGNEPCHQIAWLFNYAGQPWKTQRAVRHILATEYLNGPGGLSGNDDAGQMSAWYIFGALGFYPVCPASPYYMLGSPIFERTVIHLDNDKTFTIIAHNASPNNIYISKALLDNQPYDYSYISHQNILDGSTLELFMDSVPNYDWGSKAESLPPVVM